ncbi:hypothetical protein ABZ863_18575 [Saccharomonospora sp. NPDC046836]|uniref:hypothetical protein n=1 Tax=Saccharomonospora sp. NPDC046836 TaxID=3156921 RepID=UPI0033E6D1A7
MSPDETVGDAVVVVDGHLLVLAEPVPVEARGMHAGVHQILGENLAEVGVTEVLEELRQLFPLLAVVGDGRCAGETREGRRHLRLRRSLHFRDHWDRQFRRGSVTGVAHRVRDYRNFVHPRKELAEQPDFDQDSVRLCWAPVHALLNDLEERLEPVDLTTS